VGIGVWGTTADWSVAWPGEIAELALLALYASLTLLLLLRYRRVLGRMMPPSWGLLALLAVAGLVFSQLFPLHLPWRNSVPAAQPELAAISLLSAIPYLLAGAMLNPGAALIVGLATGLGRALGQTHTLTDIFTIGLAAWLAGVLLGQRFAGRFFGALRLPVVVGPIAGAMAGLLTGMALFARLLAPAGPLAAVDMALYVGAYSLLPLMVEGLFGGAVVTLLLWFAPQWRPSANLVPSPFGRSLQNYMTASFFWFAVVLVLLSAGAVFALSTRTMSRALVEQMAFSADATAARLPAVQAELSNILVQYSADERLVAGGSTERAQALSLLGRSAPQFDEVLLVAADGQVASATGAGGATTTLTTAERGGVSAALSEGRTQLVGGRSAGESVFTLIVPVGAGTPTPSALVGRVAQSGLADLMSGLSGVLALGRGYLVDGGAEVVLSDGVGAAPETWQPPALGNGRPAYVPPASRGAAYETVAQPEGGRELVYYTPVPGSNWLVVTAVPHSVILRQALGVIAPVALLLLLVSILFFVNVSAFGRGVSRPIGELVDASRAIAGGGGLEKSVRVVRDDELGQLSAAFGQMQRSLKQRLDELNLLLTVSNEVAASINISQGMPAVLQGMLRGTGAAAARAVVRNPSASYPLVFAEGPAAEALAPLDRPIMNQIRTQDEMALSTAEAIQEALGGGATGIAALFALPLRTATEFQGVIYLGYRQGHYFDSTERNLLHTLAGQATVLVHNAQLFTAAESGRQRLAAILASTTNAVIVTDQTDRILLTNPATEHAFHIKSQDVAGRPVRDVIRPEGLAARLAIRGGAAQDPANGASKVEVEVNGRTFLANIAPVHSSAGQALGRVAVLHDITDFKELDRMKSDFLAGVSHDLLSPLTYMRNYASMMPMTDDVALQQAYVDKILGGIDRMTHMINDLLDLARIEAGMNLQVAPVGLSQMLVDVAQEHWSHAHAVGLTIKTHVSGTPMVQGDPVLLRRAVTNLVTNAIKYAPHSGDLVLHAATAGRETIITVHDNGPGIPAAEIPHLFESFYRGRAHQDGTRGSGLGLAIVKSVVEVHGGRVSCESAPDVGSTFTITLPSEPRFGRKPPAGPGGRAS
jgi:PAS domain S-box-containing protein